MPFEVLSWRNDWARVRGPGGEAGWIHRSVLSDTNTVVVREKFAHIRTGPGLNFPVAWTAEKGVPFEVLETEGAWLGVSDASGNHGWVFQKLVWGKAGSNEADED
jgi:SH3-like domain-containing protein